MSENIDNKLIFDAIPVLPLRDIVVFPHMIVPLFVGREKSIKALEEAMAGEKNVLLAAQKDAQLDEPAPDEIHGIGTLSHILQMLRLPDGTVKVLVEGQKRVRLTDYTITEDYFAASYEELDYLAPVSPEHEALMRSIVERFERYAKLNKKVPQEVLATLSTINEAGKFSDTVAAHLMVKLEDKQELLETVDVAERMEAVLALLETEIESLQIERKIRSRVKCQIEYTQKEYYLNE